MKIAISSSGPDLESTVDPRFGRCAYIVFLETDTMDFEAVPNPNVSAGGGAGIGTAQMVVDRGAKAVLTGNVGPNAFGVLNQAGIAVYTGVGGTVRQAVEDFRASRMTAASAPTVGGHFGMQAPTGGPGKPGPGPAAGFRETDMTTGGVFPGAGTEPAAGVYIPGTLHPGPRTAPGKGRGRGRGCCGGRDRGGGPRW